MQERIICFTLGLSDTDEEKGKAAFHGQNMDARLLATIPITETMLAAKVGETLDGIMADSGQNGASEPRIDENASPAGLFKYRVVVVNASERQQVMQVMRSFKAVMPDPHNIIFAVITDTARTWTFGDYVGHLVEEHEHMKARERQKDVAKE
jgi:hypothetical protein